MKLRTPNNFPIVIAGLNKLDDRVLDAAEKGLRKGLEFAKTISMREFLSGPRPKRLDVVTTRLRSSIATSVQRSGKGVIGRIGSNVKYARYHEFGFTGVVYVRPHTRHVSDSNWDDGGRLLKPIRTRETREPDYIDGSGKKRRGKIIKQGDIIGYRRESVKSAKARGVSFVRQQVRQHSRRLRYKGRPFIRPALEKAQPYIRSAVETALGQIQPTA